MWSESLWALRKSCTGNEGTLAMAADGTTITLVSLPPGEFQYNDDAFVHVSLHDSDHEGVVRILYPFLRAMKFDYLCGTIFPRHNFSPAQFFPYQECNYTAQI